MTTHETLVKSIEDIQARLKEHECLLYCMKEGNGEAIPNCCLINCPHKQQLKETLKEVIEVLEESRKAFKSKQLEILRKKLIGVLAEIV